MPPCTIIAVIVRVGQLRSLLFATTTCPHDEVGDVSSDGLRKSRILGCKLSDDIRVALRFEGKNLKTCNNLHPISIRSTNIAMDNSRPEHLSNSGPLFCSLLHSSSKAHDMSLY